MRKEDKKEPKYPIFKELSDEVARALLECIDKYIRNIRKFTN